MSDLANLEAGRPPVAREDVDLRRSWTRWRRVTEGRDRGDRRGARARRRRTGRRRRPQAPARHRPAPAVAVLREQGGPCTVSTQRTSDVIGGTPMASLGIGAGRHGARACSSTRIATSPLERSPRRPRPGAADRPARDRAARRPRLVVGAPSARSGAVAVLIPLKETRS